MRVHSGLWTAFVCLCDILPWEKGSKELEGEKASDDDDVVERRVVRRKIAARTLFACLCNISP